jgi:acetyltransferase-like isoleucine patch superfamily enzyme
MMSKELFKMRISILYSWFIRTLTYFLPNIPFFMRIRGALYSIFMKECGRNFQVPSSVILTCLTGLRFGKNVYIAHNCVILGVNIDIGDEVIIGPNCVLTSTTHTFHKTSYRFGKYTESSIAIKAGSWIGANCSILGGSILPERSVLGAGAVLQRKFEKPNFLYAGVPAAPVKELSHLEAKEFPELSS